MPDSRNMRKRDFSEYDAMSDEQLRQILRADAEEIEGEESDMELLLYIMEVLAKRRSKQHEGKDPNKALESFRNHYFSDDEEPAVSENLTVVQKQSKSGTRSWRRSLIVAAAALALLVGSTVAVGAFKFDIWETVAKWTQETFHFGTGGQTSSNEPSADTALPYESLQEALDKYNITQKLLPTWIPEEYGTADVKIYETPAQRHFIAVHKCGKKIIKVQIKDYLRAVPEQIEQSETLVEVYESAGVDYYIFSNNDLLQAAWINENYECFISGPFTIEEMKNVIDSIEKG